MQTPPETKLDPSALPSNVQQAAHALGCPTRLRLIRHYLDNPGDPLDEAAAALRLPPRVVSLHVQVLEELAVLVQDEGSCVVDEERVGSMNHGSDGARSIDSLTTAMLRPFGCSWKPG